jgi:hypothetical protein
MMKKVKFFLFVILSFIPAAIVSFILGGIDAVCGTYTYDSFFEFVQNFKRRYVL